MTRRRQRQGSLEVPERRGGVQSERPIPGEGEEPQRACLELDRELGLPGGACELQGRCVVVGEDVGEVLLALWGPRLDPAGRGHVARSS